MYGHKYTEDEKKFMEEYVPGHSYREIQKEFTERFEREITLGQIKSYIGNHHLNTGRTGYFEKGSISHNKGKKMPADVYEKAKPTMFKKGNVPPNHRPVGSERISKDGYIEIKVEEPNKWRLKHRVVWENVNGKIPDGYIIIFRDNDRTNTSIENLILIKRSTHARMNQNGLSRYTEEFKETAVMIAELKEKTCAAAGVKGERI